MDLRVAPEAIPVDVGLTPAILLRRDHNNAAGEWNEPAAHCIVRRRQQGGVNGRGRVSVLPQNGVFHSRRGFFVPPSLPTKRSWPLLPNWFYTELANSPNRSNPGQTHPPHAGEITHSIAHRALEVPPHHHLTPRTVDARITVLRASPVRINMNVTGGA